MHQALFPKREHKLGSTGSRWRPSAMRSTKAASMVMVAAASFLLLVVSVAAFNLIIYLGSSRELRHTVDAAVLNVSKRAVENKVSCTVPVGYDDCADSTKQV